VSASFALKSNLQNGTRRIKNGRLFEEKSIEKLRKLKLSTDEPTKTGGLGMERPITWNQLIAGEKKTPKEHEKLGFLGYLTTINGWKELSILVGSVFIVVIL
jgi:hypothetical protein